MLFFYFETPLGEHWKDENSLYGKIAKVLGLSKSFTTFLLEEDTMPDFGNSFSGLAHERKLTHEELIRAIRFMVAAEYEAIQLYTQLADSIENKLAINVLNDIADEERVHAGEFLRLLHELAPEEKEFYKDGFEEVEAQIEKLKK